MRFAEGAFPMEGSPPFDVTADRTSRAGAPRCTPSSSGGLPPLGAFTMRGHVFMTDPGGAGSR